MADSRVALDPDRLPWLTEERKPRAQGRPASRGCSAARSLLVAGLVLLARDAERRTALRRAAESSLAQPQRRRCGCPSAAGQSRPPQVRSRCRCPRCEPMAEPPIPMRQSQAAPRRVRSSEPPARRPQPKRGRTDRSRSGAGRRRRAIEANRHCQYAPRPPPAVAGRGRRRRLRRRGPDRRVQHRRIRQDRLVGDRSHEPGAQAIAGGGRRRCSPCATAKSITGCRWARRRRRIPKCCASACAMIAQSCVVVGLPEREAAQ